MILPMKSSFFVLTILAQSQIARRGAAVDLGMGDETLLDAEHIERLEPVGHDAEGLASLQDRIRHRLAVPRRHRQLEGQFARKRDPGTAARRAPECSVTAPARPLNGMGLFRQIRIDNPRQHRARAGAGYRGSAAHWSVTDASRTSSSGHKTLRAELHMRHRLAGRRRRGW